MVINFFANLKLNSSEIYNIYLHLRSLNQQNVVRATIAFD